METPINKTKSRLNPAKIAAIIRAVGLGTQLKREHPEIAELYSGGLCWFEILSLLKLKEKYDVGHETARVAVRVCLFGYKGGFKLNACSGLLSIGEAQRLGVAHRRFGARIQLSRLANKARGHNAWTLERKLELYQLCTSEDCAHKTGNHRGQPDYGAVVEKLKEKWGNNGLQITPSRVEQVFWRYRNRLRAAGYLR